ncbi:heme-binding protein [Streptomyces sp. NPDC091377]|uniref:heme-binding protein n=1 Tax=Streptomyces sp. NPDC091377 TaxID=3365995 RepID=UPI003824E02E
MTAELTPAIHELEGQERRLVFRTFTHDDAWIDRKRRVVERYGSASYLVGARCRAKGTTFEESSPLDPDHCTAHGGSFPITVAEIGVIGSETGAADFRPSPGPRDYPGRPSRWHPRTGAPRRSLTGRPIGRRAPEERIR